MTETNSQLRSAAVSDRGLSEKRPQNEDSYLCLEDSGLFAVADGVGGAQAGDVASEMAVEILGEAFINLQADGDAEDRMRLAIEKANSAIYQMSRDLPQLSTMATTLVAVHLNGNIATIGHVGDSRLYRLDSTGALYRETQDHSVVEDEVRAGRMTREQAATHPSRNVISRALGADESVEIDMKTIMFETDSTFLICSDGVTRHIPDEELRDILLLEDDPTEVCRVVKETCYERGAEDNLTAVVVRAAGASMGQSRPALEVEEETVATARAAASSGQIFADIPEKRAGVADVVDPEFELDVIEDLEDTEEIEVPIRDEADLPQTPQITETPVESSSIAPNTVQVESAGDFNSYRQDENSGSGFAGRMLSGVVWLVVGLLIGALGYFLLSTAFGGSGTDTAAVPNQGFVAFEQQRRLVDSDPAKYIAAFSTKDNKTAGDHYLIGRAYLLQQNYGAAKTSFENGLRQLNDADVNNRKILEHDLAAGLSIAVSEEAQKSYESAGETDGIGAEPAVSPQGD